MRTLGMNFGGMNRMAMITHFSHRVPLRHGIVVEALIKTKSHRDRAERIVEKANLTEQDKNHRITSQEPVSPLASRIYPL
jgi:hypothetical protein